MAECSFTIMIVFCAIKQCLYINILISIVLQHNYVGMHEHINFNTLYGSALDLRFKVSCASLASIPGRSSL